MIRLVISSSSFLLRPDVCFDLASTAHERALDSVILIDLNAIKSINGTNKENFESHNKVNYINLSNWIVNGAPDLYTISMSARTYSVESIIVLDSTGHPSDIISAALLKCHQAWFHLDEWHRAFVLVCDDAVVHRFAGEVSVLFCIPAEVVQDKSIACITKKIRHRATIMRWFDWNEPLVLKKVANIKLRIAKFLSR